MRRGLFLAVLLIGAACLSVASFRGAGTTLSVLDAIGAGLQGVGGGGGAGSHGKLPLVYRSEVKAALERVEPDVGACYFRHGVPGLVRVRVEVRRTGGVKRVEVLGKTRGTPTGRCVAQAVSAARFPRARRGFSFRCAFRLR